MVPHPGLAMVEVADNGHIAGKLRRGHQARQEEGVVGGCLRLPLSNLQLLCLDRLYDRHLHAQTIRLPAVQPSSWFSSEKT